MFDSSNYLFILCSPGAGGHRLGRIISCIDNVYWYSNTKNGITPWDIFFTDAVTGKNISPYHYDRLVENDQVPLVGERIERWWNPEDIDYFYTNVWAKEMEKFQPLAKTQYIHWVLHDNPANILSKFPNAKIIALVDSDVDAVVDRYLETTANFPCFYHHKNLKPDYLNDYAKSVDFLQRGATEKDLWIFNNCPSVEDFNSDYYRTFMHRKLSEENKIRNKFSDPRYIKITWQTFKISQVIKFLEATSIADNYKKLLN